MAISYEQFATVMRNDYARRTLGLDLPEGEVDFLLQDDAHMIAYFEQWSRSGQPRVSDTPRGPTAAATATPHSTGVVDTRPFDKMAIWGFVLSVVTMFFLAVSLLGLFIGGTGAMLSGLSMNNLRGPHPARRGRGLAIAGLVIGSVYALVSLLAFIVYQLR